MIVSKIMASFNTPPSVFIAFSATFNSFLASAFIGTKYPWVFTNGIHNSDNVLMFATALDVTISKLSLFLEAYSSALAWIAYAGTRTLIKIEKLVKTSVKYPRKFSEIKKKPYIF